MTKYERATCLIRDALDALDRCNGQMLDAGDDPTSGHYAAGQLLRAATSLAIASHLLIALHDLVPDREMADRLQSTASDIRTHVPPPCHGQRRTS